MVQISLTNSMVKNLMTYLKANMPSVQQIFDDFPNQNQKLVYPAVTVYTKTPKFTPLDPYVFAKGTIDPTNNTAPVQYIRGEMDYKFQIDLWADSKPARHNLFEEFLGAFSKASINGISLQLLDYYGTWARFDLDTFAYMDDEASSQRALWRVTSNVLANVKVIFEQTQPIITTIATNLETPQSLPADAPVVPKPTI